MRLGALGSLQRGILNLRANWELVPLAWLQSLMVAALSLLSLLPFYLILRLDLPAPQSTLEQEIEWLVRLSERILSSVVTVPFWLALLSSSAVMVWVLFLYSFFQAGIFGTLTDGDRGAGTGTAVVGFRAFSRKRFQDRGGAHLWRFFWLFNIIFSFWLLWLLLVMLAAVLVGLGTGAAGFSAGLGLAFATGLPLAFLMVLLLFWCWLAQAEIAATNCDVWAGLRRGLTVLAHRLGAVLLLFAWLAFATLGTALVFSLLALSLGGGLAALGGLGRILGWVLQAAHWLVAAIVNLVMVSTMVAMSVGERESVEDALPEAAA